MNREPRIQGPYTERQIYSFYVEKSIEFEGVKYWVFRGVENEKHLVSFENFKNYHIESGQKINCSIDKINCAGEIFLEPEHPFYKLNSCYEFEILTDNIKELKKGKELGFYVVDLDKNNHFVTIEKIRAEQLLKKGKIKLKLERIKKGVFYFLDCYK